MTESQVRVWEENVEIPTYGVGTPDKNPMFLEKRVYQGSSGKVYPYPVIDKIHDEKRPQSYRLVVLENEYLHIEILPEIGGRIYRALDRTNNYDFVYYNRVIKPALVGLNGPWISGGIEFNWPQHHRPNTFGPVEYSISHNANGGKTVWVSEIDRMYGTKMTQGFTLSPGKAYIEIHVQLYNRTSLPQTFLWWANPAVPANEHTQSIFPPDVHAVFDHGRRDVSTFPIATGTYYKVDYSAGVDISRYINIPVPTSYMAYHSDYDFIGGYDHGVQAGILHVANHHISPGKKQWTWGNSAFGSAWERNLTDEDGPYVELMTGVYTDNQPDFSWLQPYEEKSFTQYFMPYKNIGAVKNASVDAAVNLAIETKEHTAHISVYATSLFPNATLELVGKGRTYLNEVVTISPTQTFAATVQLQAEEQVYNLLVTVKDANGNTLISYQAKQPHIEIPEAAKPLPLPKNVKNTEALYLAGLHLEQYRHATWEPEWYYLEGLRRDPSDTRINIAYGRLLLRRGLFQESETYFQTAIACMTQHNPNPYDSEAYYLLGLSLQLQDRLDEAFSAFYKATWSAAWQEGAFFALAQIACTKKMYDEAHAFVEQSLVRNTRNHKARLLKAALLRNLGKTQEAMQVVTETVQLDIANFGAYHEQYLLYQLLQEKQQTEAIHNEVLRLMRNDVHNALALATDYYHCGLYEESKDVLERFLVDTHVVYPMVHYYLAYIHKKLGNVEHAQTHLQEGSSANSDYCFPNSLDDLLVLESALADNADDAKVHYYLGNLLYDKKRYSDAIRHWEASRNIEDTFATVHRNLALAYYNKLSRPKKALASLKKAFACAPTDARILYELDQLHKKMGHTPEKRLTYLQRHWALVLLRDDLYLEFVTLLNIVKKYEQAIRLLAERTFHPWEGGEGKVIGQYVLARVELGKQYLLIQKGKEANEMLQQALITPENLGEGRLPGFQDNTIHYYLGCAYEYVGLPEKAAEHFHIASQGTEQPTNALFYNDQPPETLFYQGLAWSKLGNVKRAKRCFNTLIDYGKHHIDDTVTIDYFAVSLPDFLVFEDDLDKRNKIYCHYIMGLGYIGLKKFKQAQTQFSHVLNLDANHQGAIVHLEMCR